MLRAVCTCVHGVCVVSQSIAILYVQREYIAHGTEHNSGYLFA